MSKFTTKSYQILNVQIMEYRDIKRFKEENIPYQIGKLKLLMVRNFGRVLKKEKIGLTPEQVHLLGFLIENEACAMNEIANELMVDNSAITRIVDGLEAKKFVNRTISKEDRRRRFIQITEEGKEEIYKTMEITEKYRNRLLVGISELEKQNFLRMLAIMYKNSEKALEELEI